MRPEISGELERRINEVLDYTGAKSPGELVRQATSEKVREIESHRHTIHQQNRESDTNDDGSGARISLSEYSQPGIHLGDVADDRSDGTSSPIYLPIDSLKQNYARIAPSGVGKSSAFINDVLSAQENTTGPTIFITEYDDTAENYLSSHYCVRGREQFTDEVYHFPMPDVLPGFSLFDISAGARGGSEEEVAQAIHRVITHYEELRQVLTDDVEYQNRMVDSNIATLIRVLYDDGVADECVFENARERPSSDSFSHAHIESLCQLVFDNVNCEGGSGDESGFLDHLPALQNSEVEEALAQSVPTDPDKAQVRGKRIMNCLHHVTANDHIRKIANNMEMQFDFNDFMDSNAVFVFSVDQLRRDASAFMKVLILQQLFEACKRTGGSDERPDDYVVNVIIEDVTDIAGTGRLQTVLEQGRAYDIGFGLGIPHAEQLPETPRSAVLHTVRTFLLGAHSPSTEVLDVVFGASHDTEQLQRQIRGLPNGEWLAQFPARSAGEKPDSSYEKGQLQRQVRDVPDGEWVEQLPSGSFSGEPDPIRLTPVALPPGHIDSNSLLPDYDLRDFNSRLEKIQMSLREELGPV